MIQFDDNEYCLCCSETLSTRWEKLGGVCERCEDLHESEEYNDYLQSQHMG